jgi:hypothetical protein
MTDTVLSVRWIGTLVILLGGLLSCMIILYMLLSSLIFWKFISPSLWLVLGYSRECLSFAFEEMHERDERDERVYLFTGHDVPISSPPFYFQITW